MQQFVPALPEAPKTAKKPWAQAFTSPVAYFSAGDAAPERVRYSNSLRYDIQALTGPQMKNFIDCLPKTRAGQHARMILQVDKESLRCMRHADFLDGADTLAQAFEGWALQQLEEAHTTDRTPASSLTETAARFELYRQLGQVGLPRGKSRVHEAQDFIRDLRAAGEADPRLPISLGALRERALLHAKGHGPEGVMQPAQAWIPQTPDRIRRAQAWNHHPALIHPFREGAVSYYEEFVRMRGQLLAAFVGNPKGVKDPVDELIKVLTPGVDPDHLHRAARFLRSKGEKYGSDQLDWSSLQTVIQTANRLAVEKHDRFIRSGEPVPYEDAPTFVRIALGNEFERLGVKREDARTRNAVSVSLMKSLELLIKSKPAEKAVTQDQLMELVRRACSGIVKRAPSPASVADSKSASGATPSPVMTSPSSGIESVISRGAVPGSRPAGTRTVSRAPRGLTEALMAATDRLKAIEQPNSPGAAQKAKEASTHLARAQILYEEGLRKIPLGQELQWVSRVGQSIAYLRSQIDAVEAASASAAPEPAASPQ